jgi:hypothetical protein
MPIRTPVRADENMKREIRFRVRHKLITHAKSSRLPAPSCAVWAPLAPNVAPA